MAHALLSPSSAHRWLECTPSAKMEAQVPDRAGEAAAEGTLAHRLAELKLSIALSEMQVPGYDEVSYETHLLSVYDDPMYNEAMGEHIDEYVTYVLEVFSNAKARTSDAYIYLERKLDLTDYVPEGFGTSDVVIIADGIMEVIDLKYGKGVPVNAIGNKQMRLYGLGALMEFAHLFDINTVRTTIHQPRLSSVSSDELDVQQLLDWGVDTLRPLAERAHKGEGVTKAGEHCRFCKVKATCRAFADLNLQLAKYEFEVPPMLSDEEIADVLNRAEMFQQWIKAIEDHALAEALNGKKWPGYKLVEGRSVRSIANDQQAADTLIKAGFSDDQIYNKKLQGITALEKLLGKATFNNVLGPFVVKPPGKPTLVPMADKRPEYHSGEAAANEFSNV